MGRIFLIQEKIRFSTHSKISHSKFKILKIYNTASSCFAMKTTSSSDKMSKFKGYSLKMKNAKQNLFLKTTSMLIRWFTKKIDN